MQLVVLPLIPGWPAEKIVLELIGQTKVGSNRRICERILQNEIFDLPLLNLLTWMLSVVNFVQVVNGVLSVYF